MNENQTNSSLENSIALHSENNMNAPTKLVVEVSAELQRQIEEIFAVA